MLGGAQEEVYGQNLHLVLEILLFVARSDR